MTTEGSGVAPSAELLGRCAGEYGVINQREVLGSEKDCVSCHSAVLWRGSGVALWWASLCRTSASTSWNLVALGVAAVTTGGGSMLAQR